MQEAFAATLLWVRLQSDPQKSGAGVQPAAQIIAFTLLNAAAANARNSSSLRS